MDTNTEIKLPYSFAKRFDVAICHSPEGVSEILATQSVSPSVIAEASRFAQQVLPLRFVAKDEFESEMRRIYESDSSPVANLASDLGDELDLDTLAEAIPETEDLLEQDDDAPIIKLINAILREAIKLDASDVHIETFETKLVIRFRVDGVLREVLEPKRVLAPMLVSRVKVMAKLDIAEKRVPQDGRISLKIGKRDVDVRVSTMPAADGERIVLRLLDKEAGRLDFSALGVAEKNLTIMRSMLSQPHGIFLVTGPTGSGKTTTLYAGLQEIKSGQKNILTIEDPIEYNLEGIGQTQVNTKADMTFARGLRAMLRQDPDVVMVGEIRDLETAETAIQASLTGHLVLSTLHTNTAIGAVTRLEDMGVEPFLLASSLIGTLAQRLVRRLCPHCKEEVSANEKDLAILGKEDASNIRIFRPVGCDKCGNQGYKGRTGLHELVIIDEKMRGLIHDRAPESELITAAREVTPGIFSCAQDLILAGTTSIDEVMRVTHDHG